jgi:hypothetical protein
MASSTTRVLAVRIPIEALETLEKTAKSNNLTHRELITELAAGIDRGDIKVENGSTRGSSTQIEDPFGDIPDFDYDEYEYVHSILERIGSRVRVNSMRELADYLEKKFLGGY